MDPMRLDSEICVNLALCIAKWVHGGASALTGVEITIKDDSGLTRTGEFPDRDKLEAFVHSCSALREFTVTGGLQPGRRAYATVPHYSGSYSRGRVTADSSDDAFNQALLREVIKLLKPALADVETIAEPTVESTDVKKPQPPVATRTREFKIAFAVAKEDISRLFSICQDCCVGDEKTDVTVGFSDSSQLVCHSLEDVLGIANSPNRRITSVAFGNGWNPTVRVQVTLRGERYLAPVSYEVKGEEERVRSIADKLEECLISLREWYSPIAFLDLVFVLGGIFAIAFVAVVIIALTTIGGHPHTVTETKETGRDVMLRVGMIAGMPLLMLLGSVANWLRNRLFPVSVFLVGQGVERYKRIVFVRQALGVGFLLAVAASVVASLLTR